MRIVIISADIEIRNIIDKLAVFVARNGPEFEQMTMNKQRNNPKFYFIFGGEFHPYYRWKVSQEQAGGWGFELLSVLSLVFIHYLCLIATIVSKQDVIIICC